MEEDIKTLEELATWDIIKLENGDKAIENVLKELETLKKENEKAYLKGFKDSEDKYGNVIADNMKTDKVIDEMAECIEFIPKCNECSDEDSHECTDCIKQYFIKKVEEQE